MRIYYRPSGDPRLEWIIMPDPSRYLLFLFDHESGELMASRKLQVWKPTSLPDDPSIGMRLATRSEVLELIRKIFSAKEVQLL